MERLTVVSVLYHASTEEVLRLVRSVEHAARVAVAEGSTTCVRLALGDCGSPELDMHAVSEAGVGEDFSLTYRAFGANLGHSAGCNAVAADLDDLPGEECLIFLNPDAVPEARSLNLLAEALSDDNAGLVDARQIPFEHPKLFDTRTGRQSWASGACLGIRSETFRSVGGFDAEFFWSYCNDVDLSWRVRLSGRAAIHVPEAVVFHDKRVDARGRVIATESQDYFSTLGRLFLADRYGRQDVGIRTSKWVAAHGSSAHRAALAAYEARKRAGRLPTALPGAEMVASFVGGEYARHRF